jgi:hypothetical protein
MLGGEIRDVPFPEVPPEADSDDVSAMAAQWAERIAAMNPSAVMVQGEYTLAFTIVRDLQSRGVHCYAATTRRVVEVTKAADGEVSKMSRFEFVRFREYCGP